MAGGAGVIQEAGVNEHFGKAESMGDTAAVIQDKRVSPFRNTLKGLFSMRCALLKW